MHWFILSSDTTSLVLVSINSSYGCWIRSCFEMKTGVVSWVPSIHITQKNTLTFRPKKQNGNKCIKTKKKTGALNLPPTFTRPTNLHGFHRCRVYNKLIDFMRSEYRLRGFHEVVTPNMYDARLFLTSGHYQNYKVLGVTFKKGDGWDDFL